MSVNSSFEKIKASRNAMLFIVALAFGTLSVYGVRGYIVDRIEVEREKLNTSGPMTEVMVASENLPEGTIVSTQNMVLRPIPEEYLSSTVIRPENFEQYVGLKLTRPLNPGEMLMTSALSGGQEEVGSFSNRIEKGVRAMSILVDEVNSFSGMLRPGDRIDLLFSVMPSLAQAGTEEGEVTSVLMQNIPVLATGGQVRRDMGDGEVQQFTSISIAVSPEQGQKLVVAQQAGKLTAMLRHPGDGKIIRERSATVNSILGVQSKVSNTFRPQLIIGGNGGEFPLFPSPPKNEAKFNRFSRNSFRRSSAEPPAEMSMDKNYPSPSSLDGGERMNPKEIVQDMELPSGVHRD